MQVLDTLSRTGTKGNQTLLNARLAGGFSRYMGTDLSSATGLYSTSYQASGRPDLATGQLAVFSDAVKKGMDRSKVKEFLELGGQRVAKACLICRKAATRRLQNGCGITVATQ